MEDILSLYDVTKEAYEQGGETYRRLKKRVVMKVVMHAHRYCVFVAHYCEKGSGGKLHCLEYPDVLIVFFALSGSTRN